MNDWSLEDAEARLSELVKRATQGEVQIITEEGGKAVVVMDYARYLTLSQPSLLEVLRGAPPYTDDLIVERDKSPGRVVELE